MATTNRVQWGFKTGPDGKPIDGKYYTIPKTNITSPVRPPRTGVPGKDFIHIRPPGGYGSNGGPAVPPNTLQTAQGYGEFLNLPPGSKVDRRFIDKDGDGIDDRYQSGPGQRRGGSATPAAAETLTSQTPPQTQSTSAQTRIGGTLPDGSVKGDRNRDGSFGLKDFILPKKPPANANNGTVAPSVSPATTTPPKAAGPNYEAALRRKSPLRYLTTRRQATPRSGFSQ